MLQIETGARSDLRAAPIGLFVFDRVDVRSVEHFVEFGLACILREQPYGLIVEWTGDPEITPAARRRLVEVGQQYRESLARYCLIQTFVLGSVLKRMVARGILMAARIPNETVVVATRHEACGLVRRALRDAGVETPALPTDWGSAITR